MPASGRALDPCPVNVRNKISALWASTLFVFAYVDLFSFYRSDFRADLETGEVGGFTVNQSFLLGTTAHHVVNDFDGPFTLPRLPRPAADSQPVENPPRTRANRCAR